MPLPRVLITGSTGYVGGRLKKVLAEKQYPLTFIVRSHAVIPDHPQETDRYVVGSAEDKRTLMEAFKDVEVAYYLIHSMGADADFSEKDRVIARNFAEAASKAGVKRIIYLGGLGSACDQLSPHLLSRQEVGEILRINAEGVQVLELRASIVIGSGSLSFEMVRALTEKLPVMITPKWVYTEAQPIGIDDLLLYLVKSIDIEVEGNLILEIGGKDKVSYGGLMKEYALQRGLKRWMIPVPVLSPRLSSLWLGLVTPLYARVGRKLIESATCPTVVHDPLAAHLFKIQPIGYQEAMRLAILNEGHRNPISRWNESFSSHRDAVREDASDLYGGRIVDSREVIVSYSPEVIFKPIAEMGGSKGYYAYNFLWRLRGFLDLLVGGVGFRRGRRDQELLAPGDVVDFWRVEEVKPPHLLRLKAEMRLPGRAWLEFYVEPCNEGSKVTQRAVFDPMGITGIIYWYLLYPFHHFVFNGMLNGIIKQVKK